MTRHTLLLIKHTDTVMNIRELLQSTQSHNNGIYNLQSAYVVFPQACILEVHSRSAAGVKLWGMETDHTHYGEWSMKTLARGEQTALSDL